MAALASIQPFIAQAQQVAALVGANLSVACATLQTQAAPIVAAVSKVLSPHFQSASNNLLPILTPYMALAEPYLGDAKPHLDRVTQAETLLLVSGIFGGVFAIQLLFALLATCRRGASPMKAFSPSVFWLLMCTIIHVWVEYHFVFNRTNNKSGFQNGMDLYGAADFRYGVGTELEAGTAAMEAITALITGPLTLLLAWGIVGNKAWRWPVQVMVCTCQLYGLLWFFAHPYFSADKICSDDPFLFWVIFIGFNAPWGIVPPVMLISAIYQVTKAMNAAQKAQNDQAKLAKEAKAVLTTKKNK